MKLDAIHLVDTGHYLVRSVPFGVSVEVDGVPVPGGARDVVVKDPTKVLLVVNASPKIAKWVSEKGEMTAEEYRERHAEIIQGAAVDDDGDYVYVSLDQEFDYRKFLQEWKPVLQKLDPERKPAELKVTEVRVDSGDPDIVSMWNAPDLASGQEGLYQVGTLAVAVARIRSECARRGLAVDIPNHGKAKFVKIEGDYSFYGEDTLHNDRKFIGTLAQCREHKANVLQKVDSVVRGAAAKKSGEAIQNVGELVTALQAALSRANSLECKQSSLMSKMALVGELRKTINSLVEQA